MSEPRRPEDDDEDEQKTVAGPLGGGATSGGPTDPDFGLDDLVSLPGKRPTPPAGKPPAAKTPPPPKAPPRKAPVPDDSLDAPDATQDADFAASTPPDRVPTTQPGATMPDAAAVQKPKSSAEAPTRDIDIERELPTIVGEFAATHAPKKPSSDEQETIASVNDPSDQPTAADLSKSGRSEKPGKPFVSPLSKASRTARDPIVGTAASRHTSPGAVPHGPHALAEGQLIADRYELMERLGKGGMGEVWKAKHILLQGERAIKVIKSSISRDPAFRQRFLQEGQTMMRVKHPGVVEVTDLDETRANRELFMVMEYLKGRTIFDAVRDKQKPLAGDVRDAVRILREVALGMQRIHDERIVHKDLKSDNVLLVRGDDGLEHPKVIDFGLAKRLGDQDASVEPGPATSPGPGYDPDLRTTLSGTLAYMAPEQFRHEPSSFQSDVYAFGVMAYEVFSKGEFPLPRGSLVEYMKLHEAGKAPDVLAAKRPDLDRKLTEIFDSCIAMKREARPASFTEVAEKLQYWLDTPEREARKRKLVFTVTAAAGLVAVAVWGVFFGGEKTATLSNLTVVGGGRPYSLAGGKTLHLPASALSAFEMRATIGGKSGSPSLTIDGSSHDVTSDVADGKFVARADLSGLADGEHKVALKPSSGAVASEFTIDVDRTPPKVRAVSVRGAKTTDKGLFTNSDAPVIEVYLDEPAAGIAWVYAQAADGTRTPGEQEEALSDVFVIKGTALGDGKVELNVNVRDLAGHDTDRRLAYVRDTKKPVVVVADYFKDFGLRDATGRELRPPHTSAHVREAAGAKLRLTIDEPSEVSVAFGELPAVVRRIDAPGEVSIDVPQVSERGVATKLVVRDVAGNEWVQEFPLDLYMDGLRVTNGDLQQSIALKAGDAGASFVVIRMYPMGEGLRLWSRQIRSADGSDVAGAEPQAFRPQKYRETDEDKTHVFGVTPSDFKDGVYEITATVQDAVRCMPLTLTVDSTPPAVESVHVADAASGSAIAADGWALAPEVVVTAVVADLSLKRLELDGTPPKEPIGPGRRTYTFAKRLEKEGPTTWTLALADAVGQTAEKSVTIRGDWTTPQITRLDSPTNGQSADNTRTVAFVGECSESNYKLIVDGLPNGETREANCISSQFTQPFLLPPTDGPVPFRVVAVDPAGHRSEPKIVTLNVVLRKSEKPPEITWRQGVVTLMEKVVAGDVVLSACAMPVSEAYVDKTEVTNAQYRVFLDAVAKDGDAAWRHPGQPKAWSHVPPDATWKDAKWNKDDLPVVNVAYWDAFAFAKWSGRRLPTEAEWVKAAAKSTAKGEVELRQWPPFGTDEEWRNGVLATAESVKGPASALTGDDVSPCGCLHMGGNVSEWVDLAAAGDDGKPQAGTRGGNWYFTKRAADVRNTPGKPWDRSFREKTIGFRCAVDAERVQQ